MGRRWTGWGISMVVQLWSTQRSRRCRISPFGIYFP